MVIEGGGVERDFINDSVARELTAARPSNHFSLLLLSGTKATHRRPAVSLFTVLIPTPDGGTTPPPPACPFLADRSPPLYPPTPLTVSTYTVHERSYIIVVCTRI